MLSRHACMRGVASSLARLRPSAHWPPGLSGGPPRFADPPQVYSARLFGLITPHLLDPDPVVGVAGACCTHHWEDQLINRLI